MVLTLPCRARTRSSLKSRTRLRVRIVGGIWSAKLATIDDARRKLADRALYHLHPPSCGMDPSIVPFQGPRVARQAQDNSHPMHPPLLM